jgi:hypothetical protein
MNISLELISDQMFFVYVCFSNLFIFQCMLIQLCYIINSYFSISSTKSCAQIKFVFMEQYSNVKVEDLE